MRRLCGEGSRSYLGRSRLTPERATVLNRSEKSAKAVVAAGNGRRAEREGEFAGMSIGDAMHQKSERSERWPNARGEAARAGKRGEAEPVRQAQASLGRASRLAQTPGVMRELDEWLRHRLRAVQRCGPACRVVWEGSDQR